MGSMVAALVGILFRLALGEPMIGLPALVSPDLSILPVKSLVMLSSLAALFGASKISTLLGKPYSNVDSSDQGKNRNAL